MLDCFEWLSFDSPWVVSSSCGWFGCSRSASSFGWPSPNARRRLQDVHSLQRRGMPTTTNSCPSPAANSCILYHNICITVYPTSYMLGWVTESRLLRFISSVSIVVRFSDTKLIWNLKKLPIMKANTTNTKKLYMITIMTTLWSATRSYHLRADRWNPGLPTGGAISWDRSSTQILQWCWCTKERVWRTFDSDSQHNSRSMDNDGPCSVHIFCIYTCDHYLYVEQWWHRSGLNMWHIRQYLLFLVSLSSINTP